MKDYTKVIGATSTNIKVPSDAEIAQGLEYGLRYPSDLGNALWNQVSAQTKNLSDEMKTVLTNAGLTPDNSTIQLLAAIKAIGILTAATAITDATESSSSTTGAFKVTGGVGIAKKLYVGTDLNVGKKVNYTPLATTVIASGSIVYTGANMIIDTEGSAASDDLTTINGMVAGDILILKIADSGRNVVIKNSASLITSTGEDVTLDLISDSITFQHNGTSICEIGRAVKSIAGKDMSASGYKYLPGFLNDSEPLLFQWGITSTNVTTVTFPKTFNTAVRVIPVPQFNAAVGINANSYFISNITASDFTIAAADANVAIIWYAVGK